MAEPETFAQLTQRQLKDAFDKLETLLRQLHLGVSVYSFSNKVAGRCLRENHAHMIASISLVAAWLAAIVDPSSEGGRRARLTLSAPGDKRPPPCGAVLARIDRHGTGGIVELSGTTFQSV